VAYIIKTVVLTYTINMICIQTQRDASIQDSKFSLNFFFCGKEEKIFQSKVKIIQHRSGPQYKIRETLMKGRYEMN